ncbi:MAG: hypothetical protein WBC60_18470 [Cognaticolwellia sp.]
MSEQLVSFELETDLLMALESLSNSLIKVKSGLNSYLKWSLIFGHAALQSAMCLSLITSATFLVRNRSSYKNISGDLDNVEWLYKKLQNPKFLPYIGSKNIPTLSGELSQIKRLQEVRNTFTHQKPDLYFFTFEELYELIVLTVKLSRFLISKSERMVLGVNVNTATLENQLELIESQLSQLGD